MLKFFKKGWLLIAMFIASLTFLPTTNVVAQSGFSTSYYYSTSYGANDQLVNSFYNEFGRYCENRKKMNWTRHFGAQQVRVWNYQTGSWYYEWRNQYYYTYTWYYYWVCY